MCDLMYGMLMVAWDMLCCATIPEWAENESGGEATQAAGEPDLYAKTGDATTGRWTNGPQVGTKPFRSHGDVCVFVEGRVQRRLRTLTICTYIHYNYIHSNIYRHIHSLVTSICLHIIHTSTHVFIHTSISTSIHPHIRTSVRPYIRKSIQCMHTHPYNRAGDASAGWWAAPLHPALAPVQRAAVRRATLHPIYS